MAINVNKNGTLKTLAGAVTTVLAINGIEKYNFEIEHGANDYKKYYFNKTLSSYKYLAWIFYSDSGFKLSNAGGVNPMIGFNIINMQSLLSRVKYYNNNSATGYMKYYLAIVNGGAISFDFSSTSSNPGNVNYLNMSSPIDASLEVFMIY